MISAKFSPPGDGCEVLLHANRLPLVESGGKRQGKKCKSRRHTPARRPAPWPTSLALGLLRDLLFEVNAHLVLSDRLG